MKILQCKCEFDSLSFSGNTCVTLWNIECPLYFYIIVKMEFLTLKFNISHLSLRRKTYNHIQISSLEHNQQ